MDAGPTGYKGSNSILNPIIPILNPIIHTSSPVIQITVCTINPLPSLRVFDIIF